MNLKEITTLQIRSKNQLKQIDKLWETLTELRQQFKNKIININENLLIKYFSYYLFLQLYKLLSFKDLMQIRLLCSELRENVDNYLIKFISSQELQKNYLKQQILEEIDYLPQLQKEIIQETIIIIKELVKTINVSAKCQQKQFQYYQSYYLNNSLIMMQIAECERYSLHTLSSNEINNMKFSLYFLDFSHMSQEKRLKLLQFYDQRLLDQNQITIIEKNFIFLAKLWIEQTFYQTYPIYKNIMINFKEKKKISYKLKMMKKIVKLNEQILQQPQEREENQFF